jgi:hypothetical protein
VQDSITTAGDVFNSEFSITFANNITSRLARRRREDKDCRWPSFLTWTLTRN